MFQCFLIQFNQKTLRCHYGKVLSVFIGSFKHYSHSFKESELSKTRNAFLNVLWKFFILFLTCSALFTLQETDSGIDSDSDPIPVFGS